MDLELHTNSHLALAAGRPVEFERISGPWYRRVQRQPVTAAGLSRLEQIEELEIGVHFEAISELETPRYAGIQIDKAWRDEVIPATPNPRA